MKNSVRNAIATDLYDNDNDIDNEGMEMEDHNHEANDSDIQRKWNDNIEALDNDANGTHTITSMWNENESLSDYECQNIDEAMRSLYTLPAHMQSKESDDVADLKNASAKSGGSTNYSHSYDWLFDGASFIIEEEEEYDDQDTQRFRSEIEQNAYNGTHIHREIMEMDNKEENDVDTSDEEFGELRCVLSGMELELSEPNTRQTIRAPLRQSKYQNLGHVAPIKSATSHANMNEGDSTNGERREEIICSPKMSLVDSNEALSRQSCIDAEGMSTCSSVLTNSDDTDIQKEKKWDAIPDFLPFEDPSTPAGSFIRRLQVENELEENDDNPTDLSKLPPEFYTEDYDPFLHILQSTPWEDDEDRDGNGNGNEMSTEQDEYLIDTLSSLDELSQNVTKSLLTEIHKKDFEIQQELKRVQAVDIDVAGALSCTKQASARLRRVRGRDQGNGASRGGIFGGMYIIEESNQRQKLRQVDDLLRSIEELVAMEASVFDFMDNFAANLKSDGDILSTFLETCQSLKDQLLSDENFLRLSCLDESRERVSHIMEYSCRRIEEELTLFLFRQCQLHDSKFLNVERWGDRRVMEYKTLLDARIVLDSYKAQEANGGEEKESDTQNLLALCWSSCIVDALYFEADRCLPRALLHPTLMIPMETDSPSEFDANLSDIEIKLEAMQLFDQDSASLRSLTMNLISIRLEFDDKEPNIVGTFHKLCSSLADVLHTYHKICESHKEEIDNSFAGSSQMRCETPIQHEESCRNVEVERIDDIAKDDCTKSTSSSNCSRSSYSSNHTLRHLSNNEGIPCIPHSISGPENSKLEDCLVHPCSKQTKGIGDELLEKRQNIWQHCKAVMVTFLKTIITFNDKKEQCDWSLTWMQDLKSFHDIFELSKQMCALGSEFIYLSDPEPITLLHEGPGSKCELRDALIALFEKFADSAHVEAMTEIGTMMACETWDLLPIPLNALLKIDPSMQAQDSIQSFLLGVRRSFCDDSTVEDAILYSSNNFLNIKTGELLQFMSSGANPFQLLDKTNNIHKSKILLECDNCNQITNDCRSSVYEKVGSYASIKENELVLGTKTALNGLARWTVRLLKIQSNLPIVERKVTGILLNLYDLYFLTVFRLCISNSESEAIVLGDIKRSDHSIHFKDLPPTKTQSSGRNSSQIPLTRSKSYNRVRRNIKKESKRVNPEGLLKTLLSKYCEADINAPLKSEELDISKCQKFIHRGQAALSSIVSLDQIENWSLCHDGTSKKDEDLYSAKCLESLIGATSSSLLVACMFDVAAQSMSDSRANSQLTNYLQQMMASALHLHTLSLRMCGTRAIMARRVVSNVSITILLASSWTKVC